MKGKGKKEKKNRLAHCKLIQTLSKPRIVLFPLPFSLFPYLPRDRRVRDFSVFGEQQGLT